MSNELPIYPTPGQSIRQDVNHHKPKTNQRPPQGPQHAKPGVTYRPPQGYQNGGNGYNQSAPVPIQQPSQQSYYQPLALKPAYQPMHGAQQPQQGHGYAPQQHVHQTHAPVAGGQYYQQPAAQTVSYQPSYTQSVPVHDQYSLNYGQTPPSHQSHSPNYDSFRDSGNNAPLKRPPTSSGSSFATNQPPANKDPYRQKNKSTNSLESSLSSKQRLESELRAMFDKVDLNHSGSISPRELSSALLNFDHTRFQDSTIILMINLFTSADQPTKSLTFDQFVSLWKYLAAYKKLFVAADSDRLGDISFGEFQKILEQIGYKLNVDLVLHLFQKFSNKGVKQNDSISSMSVGKLKFDAFIELLVYLRKLTDVFKKYDKDLQGVATINFLDFLFEVSNLS